MRNTAAGRDRSGARRARPPRLPLPRVADSTALGISSPAALAFGQQKCGQGAHPQHPGHCEQHDYQHGNEEQVPGRRLRSDGPKQGGRSRCRCRAAANGRGSAHIFLCACSRGAGCTCGRARGGLVGAGCAGGAAMRARRRASGPAPTPGGAAGAATPRQAGGAKGPKARGICSVAGRGETCIFFSARLRAVTKDARPEGQ